MRFKFSPVIFCIILFFAITISYAQSPEHYPSSKILQEIKKLNVLGNVLYLAAHPDDENTRLIAYLKNEKLLNTSYLSLTRGDGGQNLIGAEQGNLLGIIRTQELLQARKVDGGQQYFSRARDFGFSKTPDETFNIWNKEQVLSDVVWTIRNLKPDLIITRFSLEPGKTHGHHTASALLGVDAFEAAADPTKFPDQLKYVDVWQTKRIVWNSSRFQFTSDEAMLANKPLSLNVGEYNELQGKSYGEIAAESRSMHKSQGFGSAGNRGEMPEYFEHLKGIKAKQNIFEDIDFSWSRIKGGAEVQGVIQKIIENFDPSFPSKSVPTLILAYKVINELEDNYWREIKLNEVKKIIKNCLGLFFESTSPVDQITAGENLKINLEAVNRSDIKVLLESLKLNNNLKDTTLKIALTGKLFNYTTAVKVPLEMQITQPYWLKTPGTLGMFNVTEQTEIGLPENLPAFNIQINTVVEDLPLSYTIPVVFKKTDPVEGEIYKPLSIIPLVAVNISQKILMFADNEIKNFQVIIKAGKANVSGKIVLDLPQDWKSTSHDLLFNLKNIGEEQLINISVIPPSNAQQVELKIKAIVDGKEYDKGLGIIQYKHIPTQVLFPEASIKLVRLNLKKKGNLVGYIVGAGDDIPSCLGQIGYDIKILEEEKITLSEIKKYDAIITGVRAFNTREKLKLYQKHLFQYVKEGGNLIVQYNTSGTLMVDSLAPFPLKISNDRVTVESAPVKFLIPQHEVLNVPNKITDDDFKNWVQERGLYFPNEYSKNFDAVLSSNDPGENPKNGGLLIAKYGKGNYIYTGYSWFRELPAGVPGAFRLFVNMISLGKK